MVTHLFIVAFSCSLNHDKSLVLNAKTKNEIVVLQGEHGILEMKKKKSLNRKMFTRANVLNSGLVFIALMTTKSIC